jgi:hypothetical protein
LFGNFTKPPSWRLKEKARIGGGSYFLGTALMNFDKSYWFVVIPLFSILYSILFIKLQIYLYSGNSNILKLLALTWAVTLPRCIWYGDINFIKIAFWGIFLYFFIANIFIEAKKPITN